MNRGSSVSLLNYLVLGVFSGVPTKTDPIARPRCRHLRTPHDPGSAMTCGNGSTIKDHAL
jgi:hypothetical protein